MNFLITVPTNSTPSRGRGGLGRPQHGRIGKKSHRGGHYGLDHQQLVRVAVAEGAALVLPIQRGGFGGGRGGFRGGRGGFGAKKRK